MGYARIGELSVVSENNRLTCLGRRVPRRSFCELVKQGFGRGPSQNGVVEVADSPSCLSFLFLLIWGPVDEPRGLDFWTLLIESFELQASTFGWQPMGVTPAQHSNPN